MDNRARSFLESLHNFPKRIVVVNPGGEMQLGERVFTRKEKIETLKIEIDNLERQIPRTSRFGNPSRKDLYRRRDQLEDELMELLDQPDDIPQNINYRDDHEDDMGGGMGGGNMGEVMVQ